MATSTIKASNQLGRSENWLLFFFLPARAGKVVIFKGVHVFIFLYPPCFSFDGMGWRGFPVGLWSRELWWWWRRDLCLLLCLLWESLQVVWWWSFCRRLLVYAACNIALKHRILVGQVVNYQAGTSVPHRQTLICCQGCPSGSSYIIWSTSLPWREGSITAFTVTSVLELILNNGKVSCHPPETALPCMFIAPDWWDADSINLYTDASSSLGFGAYFEGAWIRSNWQPRQKLHSIQWLLHSPGGTFCLGVAYLLLWQPPHCPRMGQSVLPTPRNNRSAEDIVFHCRSAQLHCLSGTPSGPAE